MCRALASKIESSSQGKISVIPLMSNEAESLLKQFYPNDHPFSYFLIEKRNGHPKLWRGSKAAVRLCRHLPIWASAQLVATYLSFRVAGYKFRAQTMKEQIRSQNSQPLRQRRQLMHAALLGGIALALGSILPQFPVGVYGSTGNTHLTKLPTLMLNKSVLIDGKLPKHIIVSRSGQILEAYNEFRPAPPKSPDCLCFPCPCCNDYGCCMCMADGCFTCCQDCEGTLHCDFTGGGCGPPSCCPNP